jgi:hypothetical protein
MGRITAHRMKNCECHVCWQHIARAPPKQTDAEEIASFRFDERKAKAVKKQARKDVKDGKQRMMADFFTAK